MTFKKFILASIIAGLILFAEFKLIPLAYKKIRYGGKNVVSPLSEVENSKSKLVESLDKYGFRLNSGPFYKDTNQQLETVLTIKGQSIKIIFSTKKDFSQQLASLQLILKEATIEESFQSGNPPELIDLTGNKPYVSF